jgi:2-phospho-L-lactate/phosphoenolpyruvate guanylyltransferase
MSSWVLVPVKARAAGKQRLASILTEGQRAELIEVMLGQVLAASAASPKVAGVLVITPDPASLGAKAQVLTDAGLGLNEALQGALPELGARGAQRLTIIFADLPLITAADVTALIEAGGNDGIALAADHTGRGTNGVSLALPCRFRFHFGPGSLERHLAEAAACGIGARVVQRPGLALDVDEPADVAALKARGEARYAFLR